MFGEIYNNVILGKKSLLTFAADGIKILPLGFFFIVFWPIIYQEEE